ncbi:MAG: rhomboid family intramembrane serine protease [Bacteroidales bacterium]
MNHLSSKLKQQFKTGGVLTQLIFINVGVFLFTSLLTVMLRLFNFDADSFLQYLYLPSNVWLLLQRPWTIITYMFCHSGILHLLFNMLWLFWFGSIFKMQFNQRTLGGLYFLGGIFGAFIFVLSYNLFPYFEEHSMNSSLVGASASVLAIVVATAMRLPNVELNFMFIGSVKLKYVAIAIVLLDLVSVTSDNAGGHLAHLGGALAGYLFSINWKSGKDITSIVNRFIDKIVNLFKSKPKMRVHVNQSRRAETDIEYRKRKAQEEQSINAILEKIKQSGYESLSKDEKKSLFDASRK